MPSPLKTLSVLFADISRSTSFYDILGDNTAQKVISECLNNMIAEVRRHNGKVIKTIGDEILCTFCESSDAIEAACGIQHVISDMTVPENQDFGPICVKIGIHTGPVIEKEKDVFGDTVNVAARMVSRANPKQIVTTGQTANSLAEDYHLMIRSIDRATVRGKEEEFEIYEIVWHQQDLTMVVSDFIPSSPPDEHLEITYGKKCFELNRKKTTLTIGRHTQNDIVVENVLTSRSHATVEFRNNRFILIDKSSNGTYIRIDRDDRKKIHRGEIELIGTGAIWIGQENDPEPAQPICFRLLSSSENA